MTLDRHVLQAHLSEVLHAQSTLSALSSSNSLYQWASSNASREQAEERLNRALRLLGGMVADQLLSGNADGLADALRSIGGNQVTTSAPAAASTQPEKPKPSRFSTVYTRNLNGASSGVSTASAQADSSIGGYSHAIHSSAEAIFSLAPETQSRRIEASGANSAVANQAALNALTHAIDVIGLTPESYVDERHRQRELTNLYQLLRDDLEMWATLPRSANHVLTSWTTARLRAAQQAEGITPDDDDTNPELANAFRSLVVHSKHSQPGTVRGLARTHTPKSGSWTEDARQEEERLHRMVQELKRVLDSEIPLMNLEDALTRLVEDARSDLSADRFVSRVKTVLALGASPYDPRLASISVPFASALRDAGLAALASAAEGSRS